jgi:hypothetical protein
MHGAYVWQRFFFAELVKMTGCISSYLYVEFLHTKKNCAFYLNVTTPSK